MTDTSNIPGTVDHAEAKLAKLEAVNADLLAALNTCSNYMADGLDEQDDTEMAIFRQIQAAIAKAEGN